MTTEKTPSAPSFEASLAELEAIEKQLEQADQRFEVGLATIIDVTEARAAYDLATAAIIEAENLLANAREALRETAGQYPSELAELKEETPLVKPEPENIDEWSEQAIVMNPVLLSANSNVGLAKENIEFERSGHYPTLDLVAQKGYTSQSDSNLSGSNKTHQKILGLQINIPIYAGGVVNSRTREASFRLDEAMQNEEEQRRAIIRQTRAAYNSVMSGVSRVNALQQAVDAVWFVIVGVEVTVVTQLTLSDLPHAAHCAVFQLVAQLFGLTGTERFEKTRVAAPRAAKYKDLLQQHRPGQQ